MLMKNVTHRLNIISKVRKGLQNRYFPESDKFDSVKSLKAFRFRKWGRYGFVKTPLIFSPTQIKDFTFHPTL